MSPKTGPRTAREAAWLKTVPRAMAEGLTGGRSGGDDEKLICVGEELNLMVSCGLGGGGGEGDGAERLRGSFI